jgi:hypothetical protein
MISVKEAFEKIAIKRIFTNIDNLKWNELLQSFVDGIGSVENIGDIPIS